MSNLVPATQVKRPWRTTVRSSVQLALALASLLPLIFAGVYTDTEQAPAVVLQVLGVAAGITRVMALPQVEGFLRTFAPWLAAEPTPKMILGKAVMADPRKSNNEEN